MKKLLLLVFVLVGFVVHSQYKKTEKILKEGQHLSRLEKGSWYATDDMRENYKEEMNSFGGYVTYEDSDKKIISIFYSRDNPDRVLLQYEFENLSQSKSLKVESLNREATELEKDLIYLRRDAQQMVSENTDDFFSFYENTALNFIPIINKKSKRVFILTGSQVDGFLFIGNDYLLQYGRNNNFKSREKLHNSILKFPFRSDDFESPMETTIHSHIVTDYITSTDVCTFLLHKEFLEWRQHIVISNKMVSIFDLDEETIFTIKTKDWKKMSESVLQDED